MAKLPPIKKGSLYDEALNMAGAKNRPQHQAKLEDAINKEDYDQAQRIINNIPYSDPYRLAMQSFVNNYRTEATILDLKKAVDALNSDVEKGLMSSLKINLTDQALQQQLQAIQGLARMGDTQIRAWLMKNVPPAYVGGVNIANIRNKEVTMTFEEFSKGDNFLLHRSAINILLKESYLDFGNTMVAVVKGAERILTDVAKRQIRGNLVQGEIQGSSIPDIAKDIGDSIRQDGFTVMINRAGHKWNVSDYSEMLARTNIIKSANEGVTARVREAGGDIVEWSTAEDEMVCPICEPLDGKVFSTLGTDGFKPLDMSPPAHPNCRCALLPRPDIDTGSGDQAGD